MDLIFGPGRKAGVVLREPNTQPMVISAIRNMFSGTKKNEIRGSLYMGKSVLLRGCMVSATSDMVVFSTDSRKLEYGFKEISSVEHKDRGLAFVYRRQKYLFKGDQDLTKLYEDIHPLIGACEVLYEKDARYSVYRTDVGRFEEMEGRIRVFIVRDNGFFIKVESEEEVIHFEMITSETQYYMDQKNMTFVWSVPKDGMFYTFSITFLDNVDFLEFLSKYVSCLYKNVNRERRQEDEEAEKYFFQMETENYRTSDSETSEKSEEYESCSDGELENHFGEAEDKNRHLVVGHEMAFVTRGKSVGVFENTDGGLEFRANIKDVLEEDVSKMITHDKCSSLIYLDKNERERLHKLDISRGEVVETWDVGREINDYFDSQKLVDSGTLVGVSDYSVFRIDPRAREKVVESKDYKTKNGFNCGVATGRGHVAVASRNGDLRLYDKIDKRAKSLLPGFGDEIRYIDVTSNGKHVICTYKNYLMLTTVPGDYKQAVGKEKPVPKKLQLKPEHMAYINEEVDFTPAKFSTDRAEDSIITSTGSYVVKWNLRDVLSGKLYSYQLAKCSDLVVADNFEFGENDNVIVTMPDDVRKVSVKSLRRPGRGTWR